jgi:hypothetical protein
VLHQALGFLNDHFSNLNVPRCRLIKGGTYNFPLHRSLHIGDLFGPLID